jgi:hypothetical protein
MVVVDGREGKREKTGFDTMLESESMRNPNSGLGDV